MSEWPHVSLGSVTSKIGSGATPRGGESVYAIDGAALIRSQNVLDNAMKTEGIARIGEAAAHALRGVAVQSNDVLINITGDSVARCAMVDATLLPARVNQHVAIVRTTEDADPRFVQKVLVSPEYKSRLLTIANGGGTRNALTKTQLSNLLIPFPPLQTQRAIAEVLGALDDKIAANLALIAASREYALLMARVPAPMTPLGNVVIHHSRQVQPANMAAKEVDLFSLPGFDSGSGAERVSPSEIKSGKFLIAGSVVLVSKLNPRIPRIWPVDEDGSAVPKFASTEFLVLEPFACTPDVLWSLLSQPEFTSALEGQVAGTSGSHQRVRPADLLSTGIPDPRHISPQLHADINEVLAPVRVLLRENRTLAATRDALLPPLMSGKLSVRDAEVVASAAGA